MSRINYTIKPASAESFLKLCLKEGFRPQDEHIKSLGVFKNGRLVTALPFKLFTKELGANALIGMARELGILHATSAIDPEGLSVALKQFKSISGKIVVHLPFLCPGFPVLYSLKHPFIEMASFNQESFLAKRVWLKRQEKKFSEFTFTFSEFDFNKDKRIAAFYFKYLASRFQYSKAQISERIAEFKADDGPQFVAVLKDKNNIVAVQLMQKNLQQEVSLLGCAFNDELSQYSPGNALRFRLLCHLKETRFAKKVFFGAMYHQASSAYKLKWCDCSITSYLHHV